MRTDQALLCEHVITRLFSSGSSTNNVSTITKFHANHHSGPVASTSSASHPGSGPIGVGQPGVETPPHSPRPGKEVVTSSTPNLGEFIVSHLSAVYFTTCSRTPPWPWSPWTMIFHPNSITDHIFTSISNHRPRFKFRGWGPGVGHFPITDREESASYHARFAM